METLLVLVARIGVVLTVIALGLRASLDDATSLFRRPALLAKALFSMNVVMPACAAAIVLLTAPSPPVAVALMALAVSPVPPILPQKVVKAGGAAASITGFFVAASLLAIVFVPVAAWLLGGAVGEALHVSIAKVALILLATALLPVAIGVVIHRLAPVWAERIAKPVSIVGAVLLLGGVLPILIKALPTMLELFGNGTLLAFIAFTLVGLLAGHLLGGPDPDERTVLAFTTSSRHPGVALLIAGTFFPDQKRLLAALLLYLLVNALVSIPYQRWAKHRHLRLVDAAAH
jgi:BASS family bile acid:Na+ symporter